MQTARVWLPQQWLEVHRYVTMCKLQTCENHAMEEEQVAELTDSDVDDDD